MEWKGNGNLGNEEKFSREKGMGGKIKREREQTREPARKS